MTRTERTYYVVFGGYTLAAFFIAPIYPLFLMSRGLDLFQINVVLAVYLVAVFALEVPTGAIADRFGRKLSFLLACAVRAAAYVLYARAEGFGNCLVAEVIDALGTTLASGALDAWMIDGVHREGDRRPIDGILARGQVIGRTLMIGGGIACGYLAERSWALPWVTCALVFAATGVVGALTTHEQRGPAGHGPATLVTAVREGIGAVAASPVLLVLCGLAFATAFGGFPIHMVWPAHIEAPAGEGLWRMGWITAGLNLASLVGSALVPRARGALRRETVLLIAAVGRAVMLGIFASATSLRPAVAGLVIQEISGGLTEPVSTAWTNEHVAAAQRATVLSVRSTCFTLGGALGLLTLGGVARYAGIPACVGVSAAVFAVVAPGALLLGRADGRSRAVGPERRAVG